MQLSADVIIQYPRTPHLFGSAGTGDDRHLGEVESQQFLADDSLIIEEKVDGTNVGVHFLSNGEMVVFCRGRQIEECVHRQYELFRNWAAIKRRTWDEHLKDRYILFGEWLFARHSIHYLRLPHYFLEFDIYDKCADAFLGHQQRSALLDELGVQTVPVLHRGATDREHLQELIEQSRFDSRFHNPVTGSVDHLMEGLYLRTESCGIVTRRAKFVRPEFAVRARQDTEWKFRPIVPNLLNEGADIWA